MTDIEIAQKNVMVPIADVAEKIGIKPEELELYGPYKAKLTMKKLRELQSKASDSAKRGKLILVTALVKENRLFLLVWAMDSEKSGKNL